MFLWMCFFFLISSGTFQDNSCFRPSHILKVQFQQGTLDWVTKVSLYVKYIRQSQVVSFYGD